MGYLEVPFEIKLDFNDAVHIYISAVSLDALVSDRFYNRAEAAKRLCYLFLAGSIIGIPLFGRLLAVFN